MHFSTDLSKAGATSVSGRVTETALDGVQSRQDVFSGAIQAMAFLGSQ